MAAPDRACPDYPNECFHPWAHVRTHADVKATQAGHECCHHVTDAELTAERDRLREQAYAVQPVLDAVQAWAELVDIDGSAYDHTSALVTLYQAVEQYRLLNLAFTAARAEQSTHRVTTETT